MPKAKLTGKQVRKAIVRDDLYKLKREREAFHAWWYTYDDRDDASMNAAWFAWKRRAGLK